MHIFLFNSFRLRIDKTQLNFVLGKPTHKLAVHGARGAWTQSNRYWLLKYKASVINLI